MTSKKTISARGAGRNIGDELLLAIRDIKAGKYSSKYSVEADDIAAIGGKFVVDPHFGERYRVAMRCRCARRQSA